MNEFAKRQVIKSERFIKRLNEVGDGDVVCQVSFERSRMGVMVIDGVVVQRIHKM